jgi:Xaa-Pro aminopeptidase
MKPGAIAEDVQGAANEVYREAGLAPGYRTGRGVGMSNLEPPELKKGDRTVLQPGMTLAVDGSVSVPGRYALRLSDTILVTPNGYELLTAYPKDDPVV